MMIGGRFSTWLFSRAPEPISRLGIIAWWEIRRVPYNLIVGVIGVISLFFFFVFISISHELSLGEDAVEPMLIFITPVVANIFYTGGWIVELFLSTVRSKESSPVGPKLMKFGIVFSIIIIMLPSIFWLVRLIVNK